MNDIINYMLTKPPGTFFVTEIITKKVFFRCSTLLNDYVIIVSRGLCTEFTSWLYSPAGFVGFFDTNKSFNTYSDCAIYCSNHISEYSIRY